MADREGMIEVELTGQGGYFAIIGRPGDVIGHELLVPGDDEDRERWMAARAQFEKDLADAHAIYGAPVCNTVGLLSLPDKRCWWHWLCTRRERKRLQALRVLHIQAKERYAPVEAEIYERAASVRAERIRIAREARAEQERVEQAARERRERHTHAARHAVWCWNRKGREVAVVFRNDVETAQRLSTDPTCSGPMRLDKLGDELHKWGMRTVRWEPTSTQAVVAECAEAGEPLTFAEWWEIYGPWTAKNHGPTGWCTSRAPWPVPTRRSREALHNGTNHRHVTSHHSSYGAGGFGGI